MLPSDKLKDYLEWNNSNCPLFMRGRTLDNAFVILDEAQKYDFSNENVLTRMGKSAVYYYWWWSQIDFIVSKIWFDSSEK